MPLGMLDHRFDCCVSCQWNLTMAGFSSNFILSGVYLISWSLCETAAWKRVQDQSCAPWKWPGNAPLPDHSHAFQNKTEHKLLPVKHLDWVYPWGHEEKQTTRSELLITFCNTSLQRAQHAEQERMALIWASVWVMLWKGSPSKPQTNLCSGAKIKMTRAFTLDFMSR